MLAGYFLGFALIGAAVLIVYLMLRELRLYYRRDYDISGRHVIVRLVVGLLLLGLISQVLLGSYLFFDPEVNGIYGTVVYWSKNVALGYFIMVIALLDLGLVLRYNRRRRRWQESSADRLRREYPQLDEALNRAANARPDA